MEYNYVFVEESLLGFKEPGILISEELKKKNVQFMDGDFIIIILNQKNIIYVKAEDYPIKNMPLSVVSFDMSRCIVFPLEMLEAIKLKEGVISHVSIYVGESGCNAQKIEQIIHTLEMKYGTLYHFSFSNKYYQSEYETIYFTMIPGYLGKMAVVIMIVVMVGYTGIVKLYLERRNKELAICKAVGASDAKIAAELILEIATICITGCLLGGMIGGGLTKWITFSTKYQVLYHYKTIFILAIVGVLYNVNLEINQGEFVILHGSSGSGKTTLLNIIGLMDRFQEGSYYLENNDISKMCEKELAELRSKKFGFVFQAFYLITELNVIENICVPLGYAGVKKKKRIERAACLLEEMGMEHKKLCMPAQLSGGEKQRVAIARALVNAPDIIIADEPTGNLDENNSKLVMEILKKLHQKGNTIIMVTHDESLEVYGTRTVQIQDGKICCTLLMK